jgi:formamidase
MPHHTITVDHDHSICDAPGCSHNRWHPHIAPALRITSGETVAIETRDSLDGQIRRGVTPADVANAVLDRAHVLTGPVYVEGAEPGDLLEINILDVVTADYGFTAIFPGLGVLRDRYPGPYVLHWELNGTDAVCDSLPGVRIPAAPFMGVMGLAPSLERLRAVNRREAAAAAAQPGLVVLPPEPNCAVPLDLAIAGEAWRTVAAHEMGGNMDIRQLVAGSTLYLPVDVPGALFSVGDAHYAQGDGESCGTAIETSATLTARFVVRKGEAAARRQTTPSYRCATTETPGIGSKGYFATTGLPIGADGAINGMDATLAAANAASAMIDRLVYERGFSPEQAYCLFSVAGDLRISSIVNTPHSLVSALLPESIFA